MMKHLFGTMILVLGLLINLGANATATSAPVEFWIAVEADWSKDVQAYIKQGVDPNARNANQNPALMVAIQEDAWKVFDVLVAQKNIDLNVENPIRDTPLMYLTIKGDVQRATTLISKGADVNKEGWAPLHYAAAIGNLDLVKLFINEHAFIDAQSPEGHTPLMMAIKGNYPEVVKYLLDEGADPTIKTRSGKTAVDIGREAGHTDLADALASKIKREQTRSDRTQPWVN